MCAARWATTPKLTRRALLGRTREHRIFSRQPSLATVAQKRWDPFLEGSRADYACLSHLDQHRTFCVGKVTRSYFHCTQFVGCAAISACEAHRVPISPPPPVSRALIREISLLL